MNNKKLNVGVTDIILLCLSVFLCVGVFTFMSACPVKGESIMSCHWAEIAVKGVSVLLSVTCLAGIVISDNRVKAGLDLSAVFAAVLSALFPGTLIRLCMMNNMQCRSVMQPAVILVSSVIAIVALIGAVKNIRGSRNNNGKEN